MIDFRKHHPMIGSVGDFKGNINTLLWAWFNTKATTASEITKKRYNNQSLFPPVESVTWINIILWIMTNDKSVKSKSFLMV